MRRLQTIGELSNNAGFLHKRLFNSSWVCIGYKLSGDYLIMQVFLMKGCLILLKSVCRLQTIGGLSDNAGFLNERLVNSS